MLNYPPEAGTEAITPRPPNLERLASLLRAVAEPKRLLILRLLMTGVHCNCELGAALQLAPNLISHHLRLLRAAGLVEAERDPLDARWVHYSINRPALDELNAAINLAFDPKHLPARRRTCGQPGAPAQFAEIALG